MRRGTPRRSEQNQSFDEEIGKIPEQLPGKYFGQPYDHFKDQPLFVTVRGRSGLITEQEIAGPSFLKR
jgi:hypothetical protein